jgi:2-keto-myo-inositol isomerase
MTTQAEAAAPAFRYGLNTSTLRGHKLPLVEVIDIAARAGYNAIEPWIDEIDRYVAEGGTLSALRQRLEDSGLSVEGAIGFFAWIVDDEGQRREALEEARRNMELLAAIGGKRLAAPAFGATERRDIDLRLASERYRALLNIGERYGVIPQVEVWGFSQTLQRLGEAAFVAIESGHPDACILPDVYHLYKGGSGYAGLRLLHPSAMPVFHVNDFPDIAPDAIADADRVYTGDGIAPWNEIVPTLREIGFNGVLSLELFNATYYAQDPLTVAQTGLAKLKAVVQQN